MKVGLPSKTTADPLKQPSLSAPPGVGASAMGR